MNCERFILFIEAGPLRERSHEETEEPFRHADGCTSCGSHLARIRQLETDLSELSELAGRREFAGEVMDRVRRVDRSRDVRIVESRRDDVRGAAMLVGTLALGFGFLLGSGPANWLPSVLARPLGVETGFFGRWIAGAPSSLLIGGVGALLLVATLLSERDVSNRFNKADSREASASR